MRGRKHRSNDAPIKDNRNGYIQMSESNRLLGPCEYLIKPKRVRAYNRGFDGFIILMTFLTRLQKVNLLSVKNIMSWNSCLIGIQVLSIAIRVFSKVLFLIRRIDQNWLNRLNEEVDKGTVELSIFGAPLFQASDEAAQEKDLNQEVDGLFFAYM